MTLGSVMVYPPLPSFFNNLNKSLQAFSKTFDHFQPLEFALGVVLAFTFVVLIWTICDFIDASLLDSQAGNEVSRYDQRKQNAKKAQAKNERGLAAKSARTSKSKTIRFKNETVVTHKNYKNEILESQAKSLGESWINEKVFDPLEAISEVTQDVTLESANLGAAFAKKTVKQARKTAQQSVPKVKEVSSDFKEWLLSHFSEWWASLFSFVSEFDFSMPSLMEYCPDLERLEKYYFLVKTSEIGEQIIYVLRLFITLGFITKIDITVRGMTLFVSEPLRQTVTTFQIFEACFKLLRLICAKIVLVFDSGSFMDFFATDDQCAYDEEYTFIKSQKACMDIGRKAEVDIETYDRRVFECIQLTTTYLASCKPNERGYYSSRLAVLKDIQVSRTLAKKDNIRVKPYGALLVGESSSGKSSTSNALARFLLQVNGKDYNPSAIITLNQEDKFQSEFATHHRGVIFDDLCNTALDKTDGSPTTPIVMFLNNVPMAALNPNAELKGKVMIEPDVVIGTTNVKDLLSNQLSNEPLSINRRFDVTITQTVKVEYRKEGTMMLDTEKIKHMSGQQFPDYASFDVEWPKYKENKTGNKFVSGKTQSIVWVPFVFDGKPLVQIEIKELLQFLTVHSREHFTQQEAFVAGQKDLSNMPLCECDLPVGMCDKCPLASQNGTTNPMDDPEVIECTSEGYDFSDFDVEEVEESLDSDDTYLPIWFTRLFAKNDSPGLPKHAQKHWFYDLPYTEDVVACALYVEDFMWGWFGSFIVALLGTYYGNILVLYLVREEMLAVVLDSYMYVVQAIGCIMILDLFIYFPSSWALVGGLFGYAIWLAWQFWCVRCAYIDSYRHLRKPSEIFMAYEPEKQEKIKRLLYITGVWYVIGRIAKKWHDTLPTAQSAAPVTLKPDMKPGKQDTEFWDVHARNRQYQFGDAGIAEKARTITPARFDDLVGPKLLYIEKDDGTFCDAVPVQSSQILVPWHFVPKNTEYITITKIGGHTFENMPIDRKIVTHIPGSDFGMWNCPGAGLHRDLVDYYPKEINYGKKITVHSVYNDKGNLVKYEHMTAERGNVITTAGGMFSGLKYSFPRDTYGGMCMTTLIGEVKGMPFIAGHHLAGLGRSGAAGFLTREQIKTAIAANSNIPGVLIPHSSVPMATETLGVEFGPLVAPHEKCVTRALDLNAKLKIHGSHTLPRSSPRSGVVTSRISRAVTEIMGIEKIHGPPPDLSAEIHKTVDIAGKTKTATKFESELMQKAFIDYSTRTHGLLPSEYAKMGKISDDVNLSGLDGVMGVNSMNFRTAVGWPLKGPKDKYVNLSDREVEGISCPRDVDPFILDEVKRMEECLLRGESLNTVFKASMKDEPTKNTKKTGRVFAAANMSFVFLVRKYYLTLSAAFQRNKIATECAVGTVVQSPEWTELFEHIGAHGWDQAIAGDYAKFDGKMSPQFMLMAFKVLIDMAKKSGNYDEDDLKIMLGIATEISYPTYDYFGTLVQFFGSNPSGHPLTVVINSIVNSLYMRYAYYKIAKTKKWIRVPLFGGPVSFMSYGDDNIMTVARGFEDFNHTAIAAVFAEVDIVYTMADKEAESVPFIELSDASFLKHFAVWDDELGLYRSPVEPATIAKMLHAHIKSDVLSMEQSSAEAIQNVALKYFESGREVYTRQVALLEQVATASGIQGYVGPIPTYDERVKWYKEKFDL